MTHTVPAIVENKPGASGVRFMRQSALQAVHVPYKSSPQELQDEAAGTLVFATDSSTATLPLIRNNLLLPLAVTSKTRMAPLPNVPTIVEVLGIDFVDQ